MASSGGTNTYLPADGKDTDLQDIGNIRRFGFFKDLHWEDDTLEAGNMWERKTKSWVQSSLKKEYSATYLNQNGKEVLGSFYPTSIVDNNEKKWGILIETPTAQISTSKAKIKYIFLLSGLLILLTMLGLSRFVMKKQFDYERQLINQQGEVEQITRQVAHDVKSPITALDILSQTLPDINDNQKKLLSSTITRLKDITEDLKRNSLFRASSASNQKPFKHENRCDVIKEIENMIDEKQHECGFENLKINFKNELNGSGFADFEPVLFRRIISNILNNAHESYDGRLSTIAVAARDSGRNLAIHVRDFGKGIPSDVWQGQWYRVRVIGRQRGPRKG